MSDRTEQQIADDYLKYAGTCKEYVDALCAERPELIPVRGYYYDAYHGQREHWWAKTPDGEIVDPTAAQFTSNGNGIYEEFNGMVECAECGKEMAEEDAGYHGNYAFCSTSCLCRFVGVTP